MPLTVITKYVLDRFEIENEWKTISVRSVIQRWVTDGTTETLVEPRQGYHRVVLSPGDWTGAARWGVRQHANIIWTNAVITAWNNRPRRRV